jgi:hypothetical protein
MGDYRMPVGRSSAALLGMAWYSGAATQAYRDWVDADGRDIRHKTELSTWEITAAFIYELGGRRNELTPYLGLGGGFVWWELTEVGDFIDFGDEDLPIARGAYASRDGTFEWFGVAGIDLRMGAGWSLVAQGRWRDASDELGGQFAGFGELDLSGFDYEVGLAFHF